MMARTPLAATPAFAIALALVGPSSPAAAGPHVIVLPPPLVRTHPAPPPPTHHVVIQRPRPVLPAVYVFVPFYAPWLSSAFAMPAFNSFGRSRGLCSTQQPQTLGDLAGGNGDPFFAPVTFASQPGSAMTELPSFLATTAFGSPSAFCPQPTLDLSTVTLDN
jgi:hypothetical protein